MATVENDNNILHKTQANYGYTVTITGQPGVYRFSCSCGGDPAVVISRNPAVALKVAANHLNLHKPVDDTPDVFGDLS